MVMMVVNIFTFAFDSFAFDCNRCHGIITMTMGGSKGQKQR
jgi:hypothetical protein